MAGLLFGLFLWAAQSASAADGPMLGRDTSRNAVSPERGGPTDWSVGKYDAETKEQTGVRNIRWTAQLLHAGRCRRPHAATGERAAERPGL